MALIIQSVKTCALGLCAVWVLGEVKRREVELVSHTLFLFYRYSCRMFILIVEYS